MRTERLMNWLDSPTTRKRRKAIERLAKRAESEEEIEEVYENIRELLEDQAWSVRAKVVHYLVELALREETLQEETAALLNEKVIGHEEHPNVAATAIGGLSKLFEVDSSLETPALEIIETHLDSENTEVKLATLELLGSVSTQVDLTEALKSKVLAFTTSDNRELKRNALMVSAELSPAFPEEELEERFIACLRDRHPQVRETALTTIRTLYPLKSVSNEVLKNLIKKRLRDKHVVVKKEALKLAFEMIQSSPPLADVFLEIIIDEIALKTKNEGLLLLTLQLLDEVIHELPTNIINRHQLPKVLDTIAWNIPPTSPERKKIKMKARYLLEDVLAYSVEERRKLRGSREFRE